MIRERLDEPKLRIAVYGNARGWHARVYGNAPGARDLQNPVDDAARELNAISSLDS
jgi:hypothetical protein